MGCVRTSLFKLVEGGTDRPPAKLCLPFLLHIKEIFCELAVCEGIS